MEEGFLEEAAMSLEIWEDVEKGRRGWEREQFHASKTAAVQGQRRRAREAGEQLQRVDGLTALRGRLGSGLMWPRRQCDDVGSGQVGQ